MHDFSTGDIVTPSPKKNTGFHNVAPLRDSERTDKTEFRSGAPGNDEHCFGVTTSFFGM